MPTNRLSRKQLVAILVFASALLSASCVHHHNIDKGSVAGRLEQDVRIGETKAEVAKYLSALEINGIKPVIRDSYAREQSNFYVTATDKETVKVEGMIGASFDDMFGSVDFCRTIGAIFYFDKDDRLITYNVDCFG